MMQGLWLAILGSWSCIGKLFLGLGLAVGDLWIGCKSIFVGSLGFCLGWLWSIWSLEGPIGGRLGFRRL